MRAADTTVRDRARDRYWRRWCQSWFLSPFLDSTFISVSRHSPLHYGLLSPFGSMTNGKNFVFGGRRFPVEPPFLTANRHITTKRVARRENTLSPLHFRLASTHHFGPAPNLTNTRVRVQHIIRARLGTRQQGGPLRLIWSSHMHLVGNGTGLGRVVWSHTAPTPSTLHGVQYG